MNQVTNESKSSAIRVLAIIGFVAAVILCVWLAVMIVRFLPSAFSSLAGIADDVYQATPESELQIVSETRVINSKESFDISWNNLHQDGSYTFSYVCVDGVYVGIEDPSTGDATSILCGEPFDLGSDTTSLTVHVESEKKRIVELQFSIAFTPTNTTAPLAEKNASITIVNSSVGTGEVTVQETQGEATSDENTPAATSTPKTPVTKPSQPKTYTQTYTYFPISNPNGFVDLQANVIATGYMQGKTFIPSIAVDNDSRAAVQVLVKNIGTKTSKDWDLDMDLPDGDTVTLNDEDGLRPNEYTLLTIEFDPRNETGFDSFEGKVSVSNDVNTNNNRLYGTVQFVH